MKTSFPHIESCNPSSCLVGRAARLHRTIKNLYNRHLGKFDLTNSQLSMLLVISKRAGITQTELSEILVLEKSTVSRNMIRLLKKGLVSKTTKKQLELTHKGKVLLEEVIPAWENAKKEVNELLGSEGQFAIDVLLEKLIHQV